MATPARGGLNTRRFEGYGLMARLLTIGIAAGALALATPAAAQSLTESFVAAYDNNPDLNAARSQLRSVDENIAIARSGNRPTASFQFNQTTTAARTFDGGLDAGPLTNGTRPTELRLTLTQPLFQGFQVRNTIRQAESAVKAQRAALENTEQDVLLSVATAFADVIQNRQIVVLRTNDVAFLAEQVRASQDRFEVGEGTRTDVSQAQARQAVSQSALNFAQANLAAAEARFRQVTGLVARTLRRNFDAERLLPNALDVAIQIGQQGHPAIVATLFDIDTAIFNAKAIEGQALPTVNVTGQAGTTFNPGGGVDRSDSAGIGLNVTVPIYQGGRISAQVRQAKENLGTARIQSDVTRDAVRQNTVAAWATYQAAVRSIVTAQTGVFAAQLALQGVVEEQRVGQRTTLDVLDAQRELITSQLTLVQAERDRDVAAFSLLSAVGRLSARRLGLTVSQFDPAAHTDAVRDKWGGMRTPDGR